MANATITSTYDITGVINDKLSITGVIGSDLHIYGVLGIPTEGIGYEFYDGVTDVIPSAYDDQVLPTQHKVVNDNITVFKIPTYETSNVSGVTFIIGD